MTIKSKKDNMKAGIEVLGEGFDIRTKLDGMSDRDFTVRSHQLAFEMEEHEILLDSTGYHC